MAIFVDYGDCVFCLVEADQVGFMVVRKHQGYNLAWNLLERLALAAIGGFTDWVDQSDHCGSQSVEDHATAEAIPSA